MEPSELTTLSDEQLVTKVFLNTQAFSEIIRRYEAKLRRYVARLGVMVYEDQDDLLQDIFIRVYEHIHGFDISLSFSSWIYRIAHNTTMSMYRKRFTAAHGHLSDVTDEDLREIASELYTERGALVREDTEALKRALEALSPEYREVMVLKYFEYKSYDEIADILTIPPGTVATWINRAKKDIKKQLSNEGYTYGNT
jgi:RNA polymerase sigma-70 factor (ECF subfamily)